MYNIILLELGYLYDNLFLFSPTGCIKLDATVAAINSCWFHNRNGRHSECV